MNDVVNPAGLTIAGNPNEDEIAAIAAAYSYLLSRTKGRSADVGIKADNLWAHTLHLAQSPSGHGSDLGLSWKTTHRLITRRTMG